MVNFYLGSAALLGLVDIILALVYLVISIVLTITRNRAIGELGIVFYVFQAIIAPIFLLLAGSIFFFQGWRLDPILTFAVFLLHLLIIYLAVKDVFIFQQISKRDRIKLWQ
jgi:hypothetical protein